MAEYFVVDQDTQGDVGPVIDQYPNDIEIVELLSGRRLTQQLDSDLIITLSSSSGPAKPDMITYLIPLFSRKLKKILESLNVDNIDYYPVTLTGRPGEKITDYYLANVIGTVECINASESEGERHPLSKKLMFKSFAIDESKVPNFRLFRPAEMRELIVVDEKLKDDLTTFQLDGVRIINTRDYEGY